MTNHANVAPTHPVRPTSVSPPASSPRVAVLGLGRMGAAVRDRLLEQGLDVLGWTRSEGTAGPALAVDQADVVLLCLRDDQAVLDVARAIRGAVGPQTLVCDLSSVHPDTVGQVRQILPGATRLVDSPVMGSSDIARRGALGILAGGDVEDVALAQLVLDRLGAVRHVGRLGTGMALKATLMSGIIPAVTLVHDVLAIGHSLGLTTDEITAGLAVSPLAPIAARAFSTTADYPVSLATKDLDLTASAPGLELVPAAAHALAHVAGPTQDLGAWAVRSA